MSSQTMALSTWTLRPKQVQRLQLWMATASKGTTSALKCLRQGPRDEKDEQPTRSEATEKARARVTTRTSRGGTLTVTRVLRDPRWTVERWIAMRTKRRARNMRRNRSRIFSSCTFGIVMRSISMRERTITANDRSELREVITTRKWPTTTQSQATGKRAMDDSVLARSVVYAATDRQYELSRPSRYSDIGSTYLSTRSGTIPLTTRDERSYGVGSSSYLFK